MKVFADDPVVSVLTPVYDTDPAMLRDCIESVLHQRYPRWELCLVDDASSRSDTKDLLNHYAHHNSRVKVHYRDVNGGISAASNDALAMAEGEWVALLDHDDIMHPDALTDVAGWARADPTLDVIYTDEDKFDRPGHHFDTYHKPPWSPEAILAQMYVGHLTAYRRSVAEDVGGFRVGYEGSQDWDLLLRVTEKTQHVGHIPWVRYHWRSHAASTATGAVAKPYAAIAAEKALADALRRRGVRGRPVYLPDVQHFQIRRDIEHEPLVSVVLPTAGGRRRVRGRDVRLVDLALTSLRDRTDYPNLEVVVVLSTGTDPGLETELRALVPELSMTFLASSGRFDFARACNRGAAHARGELLLLLNDDVEAISPSWLRLMVEALQDVEVGVAGARLLLEDDRLQHAGVVHNRGFPFHLQRGQPNGPGYFAEVALTRNYLAVTGACLLTPRALYEEAGGLSPRFPVNYNDIDYCLKVRELGRRVVYVGQAALHHYESSSRDPSVTVHELDEWKRWWGHTVDPDPYLPPERLPQHAP